jgi:hypothetical protein
VKRRTPSVRKLAKGLWRAAHSAESLASRLRALGDDSHARAVGAAANALSDAAIATENRAAKATGSGS